MPIKIDLNRKFLSIGTLTCPELPDFAVLTGLNGAGKTQLLQALASGNAVVEGIAQREIEQDDMDSFRPPNSNPGNHGSNQFARTVARTYLDGEQGTAPIAIAAAIYEDHTSGIARQGSNTGRDEFASKLRKRIEQTPDFGVFPTSRDQRRHPYSKALLDRVMTPLNRAAMTSRIQRANSLSGNPAALITLAMKRSGKLPHELTEHDIIRASYYEGEIIGNTISEAFAAYKSDQYVWAHARVEYDPAPVRFRDLVDRYQLQHPPPWDMLRGVMAEMRDAAGDSSLFDFEFSDPSDIRLDMSNYREFRFTAEMTNRTIGARYKPDSLSSGEKILMALCLASFNQGLGRRRPRLLLLDELDAVLHPSMVAALVRALKSLYIEQGSKVLMTTHSPMAVAALAESEIFRVVRKGRDVRIEPTSKTEAIEELSEGIATVDAGLRIAACDDAQVTILTEGHNAHHLKRWVELNFPEGVHVFDQLPQHTSKSELRTYGRLLGRMDPATHFVIVWDCDAAGEAQTLRSDLPSGAKVTPFAFRRRQENTIARNGIENNYDDDILEPYAINKSDSCGRLLGRDFNQSRKTEFANQVRQHGTPSHFVHFEGLRVVVAGILAPGSGVE